LRNNTQQEVVKVIKPSLQFLKSFYFNQIHNMLALMLNPHVKSLWVVEIYVGHENAICLVVEYDAKEVISLLMTIFEWSNPIV
jgi:hypothetical protein